MSVSVFLTFAGNCEEAVNFYAKVFAQASPNIMRYGDAPETPDYPLSESEKNLIMYTELAVAGANIMFSDMPTSVPLVKGNNISLTIEISDENEIKRLFKELSAGGSIDMELEKTFYSDLFGMVTDKFGIAWQLSKDMKPQA